jgi:hypothetical protein
VRNIRTVLPRRPGPPRQDADKEAEQVKLVTRMLAAGASQHVIGAALGRDRFHVAALIERHGIGRPKPKLDTRPVLILIEPVRWPPGPGRPGGGPFDLIDTGEL